MDLVVKSQRAPKAGGTLSGQEFGTAPGGKGATQPASAGKLGSKISIIGRIGNHQFGERLVRNSKAFGVNTSNLTTDEIEHTGTAFIIVEANRQNRILLVARANGKLQKQDIIPAKELIAKAKIIVLQQEIPMETIENIFEPGIEVNVVDTTAAGDAFVGSFVTGIVSGMPLRQVVRFANIASALAVTKMGAQSALPITSQVQ